MTDPGGGAACWTHLPAHELHASLRSGQVSAVEILEAFRQRIARCDPELRAFLCLNPLAADEARRADERIARGESGPWTGVPVAVKDNLATAGLETTCASRMLRGFVPLRDATAVTRLRAAGAVVLGKTNMDEFGMGSSTENSGIAPARNPWDTSRVPGGSSGGSAAAVAACLTPAALGSDTGGSVRQPAAFCGIVGLKPTYGRVSRSGLVAFGSSLDQVGPLTRTVRDAAALLTCIAGRDPADMTSSPRPTEDYAARCDEGVNGLRVGVPREYLEGPLDREIADAVRGAAEALEREGARVEEVTLPHTRYAVPVYYLVATAEASSNLARYDGVRFGRRVDLGSDVAALYRASRGAGLGPEVQRRIMLGTFALSVGYHEAFYGKAMHARELLSADFGAVFDDGVELLLTPCTPTTAFRLGEKRDDPWQMYLSDVFTVTASLAGLPALSVPLTLSRERLPIAAQLIGPAFAEALLLRAAATLERHRGTFRPPEPGAASSGGKF